MNAKARKNRAIIVMLIMFVVMGIAGVGVWDNLSNSSRIIGNFVSDQNEMAVGAICFFIVIITFALAKRQTKKIENLRQEVELEEHEAKIRDIANRKDPITDKELARLTSSERLSLKYYLEEQQREKQEMNELKELKGMLNTQ